MCKSLKPNIIVCSEARITDDINLNEYELHGYKCEICHSHSRATGGVAIYVKKPIKYRIRNCKSIKKIFWYISIEIFESELKEIYSGFYRSPDSDQTESVNIFNEYIESTIDINKLNVIMGDINFDFAKNSQRIIRMKTMFDSCGLELISDFFTRITNESQTQIDIILTNMPMLLYCRVIENEKISDHETISIAFKKELNEIVYK